jgi:hypothetical protein
MNGNQLTTCQPADGAGLERTRFFPRQMIGPDDLTQDQIYFRDKMRRHNRMLHGWGVVCGARVRASQEDPCAIVVEPGYVLGPYGDEILIDGEVTVDLCREGMDGNAVSPCGDAVDPWCSDVRVNRPAGQRLYVAVRYAECQARPVRVQGNGCGCDEADCEYSRVRDSFAIKVLTSLPAGYSDPMPEPDMANVVRCDVSPDGVVSPRLCPDCPPEPWVILADVTLETDGSVAEVNCFRYRRYVASFGHFYFLCQSSRKRQLPRDVLVDRTAETSGAVAPASVLVAARRPDNSVMYIPAYFSVEAGETFATFLAREGEREYYDPARDDVYTLSELYAMAGVAPDATIDSVAAATGPLQGVMVRPNALRNDRERLRALLDQGGYNDLIASHAAAPVAAERLRGTDIRGVGEHSALGEKVAERSVAEIAATSREAFVDNALEGVSDAQRTAVENQARKVWDAASEIVALSRSWRRR